MRYLIFVFLIIILSCKNSVDKNILATAFDKDLLYEDVILELPKNNLDTSLFIEKYVDEWVSEQVMLKQALINIVEDDYIDDAVQNFKNSLLIFEYQKELVNQNFDTAISSIEILDYYNANIDKFKLDQDIFKGRLVIIDKNAPNLESLYSNFKSNDDDADIITLKNSWPDSRNLRSFHVDIELINKVYYIMEDRKNFKSNVHIAVKV